MTENMTDTKLAHDLVRSTDTHHGYLGMYSDDLRRKPETRDPEAAWQALRAADAAYWQTIKDHPRDPAAYKAAEYQRVANLRAWHRAMRRYCIANALAAADRGEIHDAANWAASAAGYTVKYPDPMDAHYPNELVRRARAQQDAWIADRKLAPIPERVNYADQADRSLGIQAGRIAS